jgi:hypothetical protein
MNGFSSRAMSTRGTTMQGGRTASGGVGTKGTAGCGVSSVQASEAFNWVDRTGFLARAETLLAAQDNHRYPLQGGTVDTPHFSFWCPTEMELIFGS